MTTLELFPRGRVDPEGFARSQVLAFTGRQLRIGRSGVIHAVAWRSWLGELFLPVPACHQGWSGLAADGDLIATDGSVTCRKCLLQLPRHGPEEPTQPALFDLDR